MQEFQGRRRDSPRPVRARGRGALGPADDAAPGGADLRHDGLCENQGRDLHNGSAMYYVFGLVDFSVHRVENLMSYPVLYSGLTIATLFAEIAIPFLLWFRATRPYAVGVGILLHLWVMCSMVLPVFGILMIATYLCFFTEEEVEGAGEWLRVRFGNTRGWAALSRLSGASLTAEGLGDRPTGIAGRGMGSKPPASLGLRTPQELPPDAFPASRTPT